MIVERNAEAAVMSDRMVLKWFLSAPLMASYVSVMYWAWSWSNALIWRGVKPMRESFLYWLPETDIQDHGEAFNEKPRSIVGHPAYRVGKPSETTQDAH